MIHPNHYLHQYYIYPDFFLSKFSYHMIEKSFKIFPMNNKDLLIINHLDAGIYALIINDYSFL